MLDNNPTYPNRRGQAMADQRELPGSYEEANRINRPPNQYGPGNTFLGVPSGSLRDPASLASARAVILGAPFDAGTSFRPGARFGPRAIRSTDYIPHSGYRPHLALRVDPLSKLGVVDVGDVNMPQLVWCDLLSTLVDRLWISSPCLGPAPGSEPGSIGDWLSGSGSDMVRWSGGMDGRGDCRRRVTLVYAGYLSAWPHDSASSGGIAL